MKEYPVQRAAALKPLPDPDMLVFGKTFTDHMFLMDYTAGQGWHDGRIVPYAPLALEPSAMVFHYAQEVFEGLKAYRSPDGGVQLFRPMENVRRINSSCERMWYIISIESEHTIGSHQPGYDSFGIPISELGKCQIGIDNGGLSAEDSGINNIIDGGNRKLGSEFSAQIIQNQQIGVADHRKSISIVVDSSGKVFPFYLAEKILGAHVDDTKSLFQHRGSNGKR